MIAYSKHYASVINLGGRLSPAHGSKVAWLTIVRSRPTTATRTEHEDIWTQSTVNVSYDDHEALFPTYEKSGPTWCKPQTDTTQDRQVLLI